MWAAAQKAVFAALDEGLDRPVHDEVPEGAEFPYVTIGQDQAADYSTKDKDGLDLTVMIHVWSRARGSKEAQGLMGAIHGILHNADIEVEGFDSVLSRFEFSDLIRDPDGRTRHGVMRFRLVILGEA